MMILFYFVQRPGPWQGYWRRVPFGYRLDLRDKLRARGYIIKEIPA